MKKELLLVGSVPLDTPEEVFRTCSKAIGHLVPALPDGESVDRSLWIIMLAYRVFHGHPDIETIKRPPPRGGVRTGGRRTARNHGISSEEGRQCGRLRRAGMAARLR